MITQSVVTALDAHALRLTESVQAIAREVASAKEPIAGMELAWSEASSDLREEMRVHANTLQKKAEAYSMNPPDDPLDKLLCMAQMREEGKAVSRACMRFREEREEHAKVSSTGVTGGGGGGGGQPSVAVEDPVMEGIDQQLLQIKRKTDETIALELQSLRDMQTRVFSQFSDQIHDLLKASSLGNEKLDVIERRLEALMKGSLPPQQERGGEVDDVQMIALAKEMAAALGKDAVVVASQRGEAAIEPRHARSQTSTTVITTDLPVVGEARVTIAATTVLKNPASAHPLLSGEIRTWRRSRRGTVMR